MDLFDYLGPRLFAPLGIEGATWDKSRDGISLGGYGLKIRTEDIARFGQLYLRKGLWNGKQVVPAAWIAQATARQTSNGSSPDSDWDQGYGYQFWRCRHGAFRGDGPSRTRSWPSPAGPATCKECSTSCGHTSWPP
jgi:CubicO group peptidase (beta-lactamase class C family)